MAKKKLLWIILIVIAFFILIQGKQKIELGTILPTTTNTIEEFELDEWFDDLFTSVGQNLNCDITSCKTETFSSSKTVYDCTSNTLYPDSNEALVNVFHANYAGTQPASECGTPEDGERNGCIEYKMINGQITINPLGSNSIYEIYNCPTGSLSSGSDVDIADCDCSYGATSDSCDSSNTCGVVKQICLNKPGGNDPCVTTAQFYDECPNGFDGSKYECDCDFNYDAVSWKKDKCFSTKPICHSEDSTHNYDYCVGEEPTCNTEADTNCDNVVSRTELGIYIDKWINNQISRALLGQVIQAWSIS